jgi:hypothetical protein
MRSPSIRSPDVSTPKAFGAGKPLNAISRSNWSPESAEVRSQVGMRLARMVLGSVLIRDCRQNNQESQIQKNEMKTSPKVFLLSILTCILLLTLSSPADAFSFIGGPGSVAVVNLGTRFNTTTTLHWSVVGSVDWLTIAISPNPPSNGRLTSPSFIRVGPWKTSSVINGLPPGTYYYVVISNSRAFGASYSNVGRIVISPGHKP